MKGSPRLSPWYSVILVLQRWNYMWRWHPVRLIMPQSERSSILKVLHMGHYAIDKMNLRDRETVYWPVISEDIKTTYHKCSIYASLQGLSKKRPCSLRNTTDWIGTTWFRHLPIERHTVFTYSWLLQLVPSCTKTAESPLNECNQILKEIFTEMGVPKCILRWWHSIHLVRVPRLHKNGKYSIELHHTQMHSLMDKWRGLYGLSRTVSQSWWKDERTHI